MTFTKAQAVKHFRAWYADLKAMNGGKADRWNAWQKFLTTNVAQGHLPPAALDWVCP